MGTAVPFFIFENDERRADRRHHARQYPPRRRANRQIGYWMGERYAGHGLMLEALELLIPYSFETLRLHRIEAACIPDNQRSMRLLEKAGFQREGYCVPTFVSTACGRITTSMP